MANPETTTAVVAPPTGPRELWDIKAPWRNRSRTDREVTGAIELAYWRGVQAGREQAERDAKESNDAAP